MKEPKKRFFLSLLIPALGLMLGLTVQSQMANPKVDNFLNGLSTLSSADAARAAFNAAKFSAAEERLLKNGLRDPKYSIQMERLAKAVKLPPEPSPPPVKEPQSLRLDQARKTAGINKRLTTEAQSLLAISSKVSVNLQMIMGTAPKITSLSQTTIEPGQELIISGTDFLPQGSVTFSFGSSSFAGTVVYWNTDFILVTFPVSVQGIGETDGTVTVRKQNARLRADAAIHFVPIWNCIDYKSNPLEYSSNPYDPLVAYYDIVFWGRSDWCSSFTISYPSGTPARLINGYQVVSVHYESDCFINRQYENTGSYIGSTTLPSSTAGVICHSNTWARKIYCIVRVKGPLGLSPGN